MKKHHESFLLAAEILRNIHNRLSSFVLEDEKHRPRWKTTEVPGRDGALPILLVDEFTEILSLAQLLENITRTEKTPE